MKSNKIIFLVFGLFISAHAEYLVYKKKGRDILPISSYEYTRAYGILQTYQWPMIIGMANKISKQEIDEVTKGEYGEEIFLRKKLKTVSPELDLVFIPTTFYELFVISSINFTPTQISNINSFAAGGINFDHLTAGLLKYPGNKLQNVYNYYVNANLQSSAVYQIINNNLLKFCEDPITKAIEHEILGGKFDIQETLNTKLKSLIAKLINKIGGTDYDFNFLSNRVGLDRILDLEYEAHKKNVGLLYRGGRTREIYVIGTQRPETPIEASFLLTMGSQGVSDSPAPTFVQLELEYTAKGPSKPSTKIRNWNLPLNSVSYGTSIFAGALKDSGEDGACACDYLDDGTLIGYALLIDKNKFLSNKLDLFYIPPMNTFLNCLYGGGEFFHARTKAYAAADYLLQTNGVVVVPGIASGSFPGGSLIDRSGIFAPIGDPMEKAKELSEFIQQNSRVLKLPSSDGGFNFTSEKAQAYIKAQKDLTEQLKAMLTIRKYIRLKKETPVKKTDGSGSGQ